MHQGIMVQAVPSGMLSGRLAFALDLNVIYVLSR